MSDATETTEEAPSQGEFEDTGALCLVTMLRFLEMPGDAQQLRHQ